MASVGAGEAVEEFTKACPKCGLSIAAPTYFIQESLGYNPEKYAFGIRVHMGPNDVEYETHVMSCG